MSVAATDAGGTWTGTGPGALNRRTLTQLYGAPVETAVATRAELCVCPCDYAGHRSVTTCQTGIKPGQEYRVALLEPRHKRVVLCVPCWTAINGENATARE